MKSILPFLLTLAALAATASACTVSPMVYDHGIPNFAKVSDGVYRSGQIATLEGWRYFMAAAGVTDAKHVHVIKLNFEPNEGSDDIARQLGYDVHYLPIQPEGDAGVVNDVLDVFKGPDMARVLQAVALLEHATVDDVWLVHCTHGQDRTGFVIGAYRVLHDGWTKSRAYSEMLAHDFHWMLQGLRDAWEDFAPGGAS